MSDPWITAKIPRELADRIDFLRKKKKLAVSRSGFIVEAVEQEIERRLNSETRKLDGFESLHKQLDEIGLRLAKLLAEVET